MHRTETPPAPTQSCRERTGRRESCESVWCEGERAEEQSRAGGGGGGAETPRQAGTRAVGEGPRHGLAAVLEEPGSSRHLGGGHPGPQEKDTCVPEGQREAGVAGPG